MKMNQKHSQGFTLPEMMMSMAVFSLMMILMGFIIRNGQEGTQLAGIKMNLEESARESLYKMGQEIREASPSRVSVINGGTSLSFQVPASVDNSGTITWSSPITYQVGGNGTQLTRIDTGTGQSTVLANDIQTVAFATTGNPVATVTYTLTARGAMINGRNLSLTSSGEARVRNA